MTNKIQIPFCFTSPEAKETYNNKPPQYKSDRSSGFELRAVGFDFSHYKKLESLVVGQDNCYGIDDVAHLSRTGQFKQTVYLTVQGDYVILEPRGGVLIDTGIRVKLPLLPVITPFFEKDVEASQQVGHNGYNHINVGTYVYHTNYDGIMELQIRSINNLVLKKGLVVMSEGIDNDDTGEISIIINNISDKPQTINIGDILAKGVLNPLQQVEFIGYTEEEFNKTI